MIAKPETTNAAEIKNNTCNHFIYVPLCYQETEYTCGVACVQSILAFYGIFYKQDVLTDILKSRPIYGTDYQNIISFMQTLGFQAAYMSDMSIENIKTLIDAGITPVLYIQAWREDDMDYSLIWRDSHYAIACGYDEDSIFFMDPYTLGNYTYIPNTELLKRWHTPDMCGNHTYRCGLIIQYENCPVTYNPHAVKYQK